MREHRWDKIHSCVHTHEGDEDILSHGVDEARKCIFKEGEGASLKTICVTYLMSLSMTLKYPT